MAQSTTAVRDGENYIINGTKRFINSGKNSGIIIVTAKTDESKRRKGINAFIVDKNQSSVIVGEIEDKMGLKLQIQQI